MESVELIESFPMQIGFVASTRWQHLGRMRYAGQGTLLACLIIYPYTVYIDCSWMSICHHKSLIHVEFQIYLTAIYYLVQNAQKSLCVCLSEALIVNVSGILCDSNYSSQVKPSGIRLGDAFLGGCCSCHGSLTGTAFTCHKLQGASAKIKRAPFYT